MSEPEMIFMRDCEFPDRLPTILVAGVDYPVHKRSDTPLKPRRRWWQFWK